MQAPAAKENIDRKVALNLRLEENRSNNEEAVPQTSRISKNQIRQLVWSKC
jgi:hypothetical protein